MGKPFRILHSADWHLGARFHDLDRATDEDQAVAQVVEACRVHQVDAVILAGDIFDTANPGAAEQRRYFQCLQALIAEGGVGSVVVIAGNHDSGARLDGPRDLLAACRIHVRGVFARTAQPSELIHPLLRRDGSVAALCAAVPSLRENDLDLATAQGDLASRQAVAMAQRFAEIGAAARSAAATASLPLVIAAHCFARGGSLGGAERPVIAEVVGSLGQTEITPLAKASVYTALGHLHRPQHVAGHAHWRYSGSLLPTGFDEVSTARSLSLATIHSDGSTQVDLLPLRSQRRYVSLRGTPTEIEAAIAALPHGHEDPLRPLLMAQVVLDGAHAGISAQIGDAATRQGWMALRVQRLVAETNAARPLLPAVDGGEDLRELDPVEILERMHTQHYGRPIHPEVLAAFRTLVAERGNL